MNQQHLMSLLNEAQNSGSEILRDKLYIHCLNDCLFRSCGANSIGLPKYSLTSSIKCTKSSGDTPNDETYES